MSINIHKDEDVLRFKVGDRVLCHPYTPKHDPLKEGTVSRVYHTGGGRITEEVGPSGPISCWAVYVEFDDGNHHLGGSGYWQDWVEIIPEKPVVLSSKEYNEIMRASEIMESLKW